VLLPAGGHRLNSACGGIAVYPIVHAPIEAASRRSEVLMPAQVSYKELCKACLWLGLTAYGGPAMVGYVREVMVERRRWVEPERFKEGLALCQIVPGATLTQVISYVGLAAQGPGGGRRRGGLFHCARGAHRPGCVGHLLPLARSPRSSRCSRAGSGAVVIALLAYACIQDGQV